jgi:amino acid adenylation domain-containing protein
VTWNATVQPQPEDLVPALIAVQARRTPDAIAVMDGGRRLTYAALDAEANRLAHRLRGLGCGPDVLVALAVGRSIDMVVGALGILRAGAAYVPVDPADPTDRLAFTLHDAGPAVVVTRGDLVARLPATGQPLVVLDREGERVDAGPPVAPPDVALDPEHLAYVIYTSGSTGRPKGVEVPHAGLRNLAQWHRRAFDVAAGDRATLISSPAFDAAVWETWATLAAGAGLVVVPDHVRLEPDRLRDWLVSEGITIAFVPTPLAERLIALPWPASAPLRRLLTGADTLHRYPPAGLPFALVNNYGPTETSVVATSGVVEPVEWPDRRPSIGRPIANVQAWILDEQRQPVGVGVAGELYIGGAGVSRGYRHRPELTAQRFIADPFSGRAGARLYRTGDRARWLPDGRIEFLGRLDDQLKIRGFRIEPDEIVAALTAHPGVAASAVAVRSHGGDPRLVAYVVPGAGVDGSLTAAGLQATVRAALPDYMIPSVFVRLPALPVTANGKVDRAALPEPDEDTMLRDADLVAPRTPVEERVAAILASLLGVERVGVEDNFFLLGGHSLLGTQLIARLRETFAVDLPLRTIFDRPTVAALAAEIERQAPAADTLAA